MKNLSAHLSHSTFSPRRVARRSFCRGINNTSDVSHSQIGPTALERLVGVEGTVTGEGIEMAADAALLVGMDVAGPAGGAVTGIVRALLPLELSFRE